MERCPNCQARQPGESSCRRCGMDLGLLNQLQRQAAHLIGEAIGHLGDDNPTKAVSALRRAGRLYHDPMIDCLRGFILQGAVEALRQSRPRAPTDFN